MAKKYRGKYVSEWMACGEMNGTFSVLQLLGRGIMARENIHCFCNTRAEAQAIADQLNKAVAAK